MKVFQKYNVYFIITIYCTSINCLSIEFAGDESYKKLPRFWTNVGFSPPAPLPLNNTQISDALLSKDIRLNTELIGSLPNAGVKHIRIHWLLSLIRFV